MTSLHRIAAVPETTSETAGAAQRLGVWLRLGHAWNLPVIWTSVLAAVALAEGDAQPAALGAALLAISFIYLGGRILEHGYVEGAEKRQLIETRRVQPEDALAVGYGLLVVGVTVLGTPTFWRGGELSWQPLAGAAMYAVLTALLAVSKQPNPITPVLLGLTRLSLFVAAALFVTDRIDAPVLGGGLVQLCFLTGVGYVAQPMTSRESPNLWPLAFVLFPFVYGIPIFLAHEAGSISYLALVAWVARALSYLRSRRRGGARRAVLCLVAGGALVDALLIADAGRPALAITAALAGALTLGLQRWFRPERVRAQR